LPVLPIIGRIDSWATFTFSARYFDGSARMATAVSTPGACLVGSVALIREWRGRSLFCPARSYPLRDSVSGDRRCNTANHNRT